MGKAAVLVGGGWARAGLEIDHSEPQARVWRSRGRAAAHRHTQRPGWAGPVACTVRRSGEADLRYAERLGPAVRTAAAASSVGGRQIQGFDGRLEGGGCFLILVRVGCFLNLARQDAGGRGLVVR